MGREREREREVVGETTIVAAAATRGSKEAQREIHPSVQARGCEKVKMGRETPGRGCVVIEEKKKKKGNGEERKRREEREEKAVAAVVNYYKTPRIHPPRNPVHVPRAPSPDLLI